MKNFFIMLLFFLTLSPLLNANDITQEKISLQLAWKHQFQFAGFYMAKEKGYYADANLDVELKEHMGSDVEEDVLTKKATYGLGRSSLMTHIAAGKKLQMLSAIFQSSPVVFIALKDSNITSIKDFAGKKIMLTNDMSNEVSLQAILKKNDLSMSDMQMLKHSYNIQSLLSGETDIMASYIANEPYLLRERGVEIVLFNPSEYGFDFYSDILFTTYEELVLHPKRAAAFTKASIKGWEYAFANIDETVEFIFKNYNTLNKSKEALLYEANALKKLANASDSSLGEIQRDKLQRIYDIYNVMGFMHTDTSLDLLYFSPITKVVTIEEDYYLKTKKVITMCVDPDWMPYEKIIENGKHVGMSADYFKLIEKILDTKIELVRTKNWGETLKFAEQRKCDIISLAMRTKEREKYFNFTKPYLDFSAVIATKISIPFIDDLKVLKDKKIGAIKEFAFVEILQSKYPNLKIVEVENTHDGLKKVAKGELFGFIGSSAEIAHDFQSDFIGALKISGKIQSDWGHSIAVRNDDPILFNILEKALESISTEQKKVIQNKWISIQYDEKEDNTFFWWTFAFLGTALLVLIILIARQKEINRLMQEQAARDFMTQLYNRRYFTVTSEQILDLAKRNKTEISLIMLDIDNFKKVNDTYGHHVGDETIIAIAKMMKKRVEKVTLT